MNRRERLLAGLDLKSLVGMEIGPLDKPMVSKRDGQVFYIDHANTETLRKKYKDDPSVDIDTIVPVDAVWGPNTIGDAIGSGRTVDYVLASHVVEHVPDFVTWLSELASVLTAQGTVRLAIPDRRYCFDYRRQDSRLTDIITAYFNRARAPQVREVLDSEIYHRHVDLSAAWAAKVDVSLPLTPEDLERAFHFATRARSGEYIDVHCWAFTPSTFANIMAELGALRLTNLACEWLAETKFHEHEFFVAMRPADSDAVAASWKRAQAAISSVSPPKQAGDDEKLAMELAFVQQEISALRRSTSWKITGPLRRLVTLFRGAC